MAITTNKSEEQNKRQRTPQRPRITRAEIQRIHKDLWDDEQRQAQVMKQLAVRQPNLLEGLEYWKRVEPVRSLTLSTTIATLIAWKAFDEAIPHLPIVSGCVVNHSFAEVHEWNNPSLQYQAEAMGQLYDLVCQHEREKGNDKSEAEINSAFVRSALVAFVALDKTAARFYGELDPAVGSELNRHEAKCPYCKKDKAKAARKTRK